MKTKNVLLVDNDALNIEIFQETLMHSACELQVVRSKQDCLHILEKYFFAVILLGDVDQTEGHYELCKIIKSHNQTSKIIIVSSTVLTDEIIKAYEHGADDYIRKPFDIYELEKKVTVFARMASNELTLRQHTEILEYKTQEQLIELRKTNAALTHANQQLEQQNERFLQEQLVAKNIFDNLISVSCVDRSYLRYYLSPLAVFGGDLIASAENPDGNLSVLLGDFTSHGLSASIGVIPVVDTFREVVQGGREPEAVLRALNVKLNNLLPVGHFCAACCVCFDAKARLIHIWNGGLPEVIMTDRHGNIKYCFHSAHLPLGILPDRDFDSTITLSQFDFGDKLYLYSDGILEAENFQGDMFGLERLKSLFESEQRTSSLFDSILGAVHAFRGTDEQQDDMTLLEISITDALLYPMKMI